MSAQIILTINLEDQSILLNEGTLDALDWPHQIQLYMNPDTRQLLLKPCSTDDFQAVVVEPDDEQQVEISGRKLLRNIRKLVGWEDNQPRMCRGEYIAAHNAVIFNLAEAETLELQEQ